MASLEMYPDDERLAGTERAVFDLYIVTALALFLLMMLLGLFMRTAQAQWLSNVPSALFYQILSMHGAGMVGTAGLATMAVMWYFLRKYVRLHLWAFAANYVLFLLGALCIIVAIFIGGYAGLWTFLYPLPTHGLLWQPGASALFLLGYLLIGVGALLFYLDAAWGIIQVHGNLGRALGVQWLFGGTIDQNHPKAVVASTMVIIANTLGILAGAVILVIMLVNIFFPAFAPDALFAKELIYWFGHMFINATIYMGVIAVYELLPRYTGKPYPVSRTFLWSWSVSTVFVIIVFPHHLMMDFAQPHWWTTVGQIVSWGAGFPVFLVTAYGALTNIHHSNIRWTMPARLMILSMFGWAAGIVPAMLDGTIRINEIMHNTQWVPSHFHMYLLLGVLAMILALMFHEIGSRQHAPPNSTADKLGFPVYLIGGLVFLFGFMLGGVESVPRRMARHLVTFTDSIGSVGAILVVLAMLYFAVRIITGLLRPPRATGDVRDRTADTSG